MNQFQIYLPPPSNWQDFQLLLGEIARTRFEPSTVVEYGRNGQRQNGVDVFAVDRFGRRIGIQCKETKVDLKKSVLKTEADKATKFKGGLDQFVIATTDMTDIAIQDHAINLRTYPTTEPFGTASVGRETDCFLEQHGGAHALRLVGEVCPHAGKAVGEVGAVAAQVCCEP